MNAQINQEKAKRMYNKNIYIYIYIYIYVCVCMYVCVCACECGNGEPVPHNGGDKRRAIRQPENRPEIQLEPKWPRKLKLNLPTFVSPPGSHSSARTSKY